MAISNSKHVLSFDSTNRSFNQYGVLIARFPFSSWTLLRFIHNFRDNISPSWLAMSRSWQHLGYIRRFGRMFRNYAWLVSDVLIGARYLHSRNRREGNMSYRVNVPWIVNLLQIRIQLRFRVVFEFRKSDRSLRTDGLRLPFRLHFRIDYNRFKPPQSIRNFTYTMSNWLLAVYCA